MFDTTAEIVLQGVRTGEGLVDVPVRWPTDADWGERFRKRKLLSKPMGRGMSESMVESEHADLTLYEKAKLDGAPTLTLGEAYAVVGILSQFDVTNITLEGTDVLVEANTMYGEVRHRMKLPSLDHALNLKKQNKIYTLPYGWQDVRILIEPGAAVYDACGGRSEDYNGAIPMMHKDHTARQVIEFLDRQMTPRNDEKHF